jgi:hypothetical protein
LFGERIVWVGRPQVVETPRIMRAFAAVLFIVAIVSFSSAALAAVALGTVPTPLMLFTLWCVGAGIAALYGPRIWLAPVRYVVTSHHVIWQRGPFRRTIQRDAISFARIFWNTDTPGTGDLELVRAVPTGALRRRLMLRLAGVAAPDRVWAIIRGAESVAPSGHGDRPLTQRMDTDERVMWSARPRPRMRAYLPHGQREWMQLAISTFLVAATVRMLFRVIPTVERLEHNGLPVRSISFAALIFGIGVTVVLILSIAGYFVYDVVVRPGRLVEHTRYLITNKRVLIQRGSEELHLDRSRIVDVIDTPSGKGLRDVFLVLDGPRARALAASGAFGELQRGPSLRPVFEAVEDVEGARRVLRSTPPPELPRAA